MDAEQGDGTCQTGCCPLIPALEELQFYAITLLLLECNCHGREHTDTVQKSFAVQESVYGTVPVVLSFRFEVAGQTSPSALKGSLLYRIVRQQSRHYSKIYAFNSFIFVDSGTRTGNTNVLLFQRNNTGIGIQEPSMIHGRV